MGLCCVLGLASREVVALRLQTPRRKHFARSGTGGTGVRRSLLKGAAGASAPGPADPDVCVGWTQHSVGTVGSVEHESPPPQTKGMETYPTFPCEQRGEELHQEIKEPLDIPRVVRHASGILGEGGDGCVSSFGPSLGDDLGLIPAMLLVFQQVGPTAKKPELGLVPTLGGCSRPPPSRLSGLL